MYLIALKKPYLFYGFRVCPGHAFPWWTKPGLIAPFIRYALAIFGYNYIWL
jgi:hypothetical protein